MKINLGIISSICIVIILSVVVSANFGVVARYGEIGEVMKVYPGEVTETYFKIQNTAFDAEDIVVEASLTKGIEIASLSKTKYNVKAGGQEQVDVSIAVPEDVPVGTEYNVEVLFKQVGEKVKEGGSLSFVFNMDRSFNIQIVEKPDAVPPAEKKIGMSVWIWILIIIVVLVVIWLIVKAMKKNSS